MSRMYEQKGLIQPVLEKCVYKERRIVPEQGSTEADEWTPLAVLPQKADGCNVHPCLEEMKPTNISFPIGRDEENKDEDRSARSDYPHFCTGFGLAHARDYAKAFGKVPQRHLTAYSASAERSSRVFV